MEGHTDKRAGLPPDAQGAIDALGTAPPQRVAHVTGQVSDEWIDAGRAGELEDMTPERAREFWGEVKRRLESWPEEGP